MAKKGTKLVEIIAKVSTVGFSKMLAFAAMGRWIAKIFVQHVDCRKYEAFLSFSTLKN
jgi:hypothetical protein